jgi:hypothetical protein
MLACVRMNTARPHIVTLATPFIELDASDAGTKTVADLCADQIRCLSLMIFFFLIGQPGIAAITSWIPLAWLHPWWCLTFWRCSRVFGIRCMEPLVQDASRSELGCRRNDAATRVDSNAGTAGCRR